MKGNTIVEMKGISKHFGGIRALDKVDFSLFPKEIVGLIGDNGAGKSTLIKILAGVHYPDGGELYIKGKLVKIHDPKEAKQLGIETVYQELALVDNLDVPGNIYLGREPTHRAQWLGILDKHKMKKRAQEILDRLKIDVGSMYSPVLNLSGGQRQAVAISRALYTTPKVVIMDEPTAALAVKEVQKVLDLVHELKRTGISVIFISHNLQEIFSVADRVVILRKGQKVGAMSVDETSINEAIELMVSGKELAEDQHTMSRN